MTFSAKGCNDLSMSRECASGYSRSAVVRIQQISYTHIPSMTVFRTSLKFEPILTKRATRLADVLAQISYDRISSVLLENSSLEVLPHWFHRTSTTDRLVLRKQCRSPISQSSWTAMMKEI